MMDSWRNKKTFSRTRLRLLFLKLRFDFKLLCLFSTSIQRIHWQMSGNRTQESAIFNELLTWFWCTLNVRTRCMSMAGVVVRRQEEKQEKRAINQGNICQSIITWGFNHPTMEFRFNLLIMRKFQAGN